MRHLPPLLQAQSAAPWIAAVCAAIVGAAFACRSQPADIHESDQAKGAACITCHSGAYTAAVNPPHVARMPETCQDCHGTKAWVPSSVQDHKWWPILNKHVGVTCVACHSKGFRLGDTTKDCAGCHAKDFDRAEPKHTGFFPLDCAMCHSDAGFKPSTFNHDVWPLEGRHALRVTPCASCHTGNPPVYKGTTKECFSCHKDDADVRAVAKNPSHPNFPRTCLDCHLMSGWTQGPPLAGLHPDEKFPIKTGKHADVRIRCLDCHKLEKGLAAGGTNTDCVNCHLGSHVIPAIDATHLRTADGGTVVGYPQGSSSTNFCLTCHTMGQRL